MQSELLRVRRRVDPTGAFAAEQGHEDQCKPHRGLLPPIVISWLIGSTLGLTQESVGTGTWLVLFITCSIAGSLLYRRFPRSRFPFLLLGALLVASARASLDGGSVSREYAQLLPWADGRIVHLTGRVADIEQTPRSHVGRLEQFGHVPTRARFQIADSTIRTGNTARHLAALTLDVHLDMEPDEVIPLRLGDQVSLRGRLHHTRRPSNPGQQVNHPPAIWVDVPDAQLIRVVSIPDPTQPPMLIELVDAWRMLVRSALDSGIGHVGTERARSLVRAIVLGIRSDDFNELSIPYRRTGLAHYLAVSGFALGILVAIPGLILMSRNPTIRGLVVLGVVTAGLLSIDTRAPALRAGLVASAAALGVVSGRNWNMSSLLALAAMILLLINPREILNAGFQLSFMVVAALLFLAPVLERRIPGPVGIKDGRIMSTFIGVVRKAFACGTVAWLTATPIVLHHFGIISPIGIILSIIAAPLVTMIIALAIATISTALVDPMISIVPGSISTWFAMLLDVGTSWSSSIPGSCFVVPSLPAIWVICAELLVWRWVLHIRPVERSILVAASVVLILSAFLPETNAPPRDSIDLLTLDVGNGSCHVVRGSNGSVMFDAGSSSMTSTSHRVIIPALHSVGIKTLDSIIITHANLDHFAAVGDLLARIPVGELIVGASFLERARDAPDEPPAMLLAIAGEWSVPVTPVHGGETRIIGGMRWRFLHPARGSTWATENDTSLVVRVDHPETPSNDPASILFTGDIEEAAMQYLLEQPARELRARILEAPHHGSVRPSTARFIDAVDPELIIQSTGKSRLVQDHFGKVLDQRRRLVTAKHGAIFVRISSGSTLETSCFHRDLEDSIHLSKASHKPF